ncbi:MAG: hypothetical protein U1F68_11365 [Gammaproteobacteria bacterium]
MNRRIFLNLAACTVALRAQLVFNFAEAARPTPLSQSFSLDNFRAHQGEKFAVSGGKGLRQVISLHIVEVIEGRRDAHTENFSVRFKGPRDYTLDKNVYRFTGADGDEFQLWIELGGEDAEARYYRADFNLLR